MKLGIIYLFSLKISQDFESINYQSFKTCALKDAAT